MMTPYGRLIKLVDQYKKALLTLLVYVLASSGLMLSVPITEQIMVQTIAAGVMTQQMMTLAMILLVVLLLAGGIKVLELYLVEILQQRIFAHTALSLADSLPSIQYSALGNRYAPELLNRFFDVVVIQKSLAKLLLEVHTAFLQILVGLTVLALYSPALLIFDIIFVFFFILIYWFFGQGAVKTSLQESTEKYRIAAWLQDIARAHISLKLDADRSFLLKKADQIIFKYLVARKEHFKVILRQTIGVRLFQAFAAVGILSVGGFLVINNELSLGQLVASGVIMVMLLYALEKLVAKFSDFYDLLTALEKVAQITDLPIDYRDSLINTFPSIETDSSKGLSVECKNLSYAYIEQQPILNELNLSIQSSERVSLVGFSGSGKSTLALIICGVLSPQKGQTLIGHRDIKQIPLVELNRETSLVGDEQDVFEGTFIENITVGRSISYEDIQWALKVTCLDQDISKLPDGLNTLLKSTGVNLSRGQIQRIMLARAIVDRPKLLILDESFTGIDDVTRLTVLDNIMHSSNPWTVIDISHDPELILRSERIHVLSHGKITTSGNPLELLANNNKNLLALFPALVGASK